MTETLTSSGVDPPAGVAESQLPPDVVDAFVVKLIELTLLVVWTNCAAGAAPPATVLKLSVEGVAVMVLAAVTFKVTLTFCGLLVAPVAAIAT